MNKYWEATMPTALQKKINYWPSQIFIGSDAWNSKEYQLELKSLGTTAWFLEGTLRVRGFSRLGKNLFNNFLHFENLSNWNWKALRRWMRMRIWLLHSNSFEEETFCFWWKRMKLFASWSNSLEYNLPQLGKIKRKIVFGWLKLSDRLRKTDAF